MTLKKLGDISELIKLEHALFTLPFAYLGMVLAAGGWPTWHQFLWITVALVAARTVAMSVNRLADRVYDAQNPRTAGRPHVDGRVAPRTVWLITVAMVIVLVIAAAMLGPLPLELLPVALLFLVGYAFTKRFTWLSHYILGITDSMAPVGAWVAVRGSLFTAQDLPAWLLLVAVTFWIGGSDLIYACQDVDFDRSHGLHAIPARFGIPAALRFSTISHVVTVLMLVAVGVTLRLQWPYALGLALSIGLLIVEHRLVVPDDLSRLNVAFFQINSIVSFVLFGAVLAALFV